jgi:hypothetical protein
MPGELRYGSNVMPPSLRSFFFVVCLAPTVVGCSRASTSGTPEGEPPVGSAATAPAAPTAAPAAPAAAPGAPAAAPAAVAPRKVDPREAEIVAVVKRWNDALATRNTSLLKTVYGAQVRLCTKAIDRDAAIKAKAAALAAAKDYTQSISAVEVDLRESDRPRTSFQKKWTANGKEQTVVGSLVLAKEAGTWVVVEESDAKTDERRARAAASQDSCEALVIGVVSSTPKAASLLAGPTNPAGGHSSNGLRIGGGPPESPTFGVAVHENHADHLVTLAWFDVDPKTGKVTDSLDGEEQKAGPALVQKMMAACAK